jgi:hypothetical protein
VTTTQIFEEIEIGAMVLLQGRDEYLEMDDCGILKIPQGHKPSGFNIMLLVPNDGRFAIAQKNVGQEGGGYHTQALRRIQDKDVQLWAMHDPIEVMRAGKNVWTSWHQAKPNRVDIWRLDQNGELQLFQVGVITHDDGTAFRLLGESRWKGQLFQTASGKYVGKPAHPKWGPMSPKGTRDGIFEHKEFQKLLATARIPAWNGTNEELEVPLGPLPTRGQARVEWYIPFAGQTGQGIAFLCDGTPAWVHGKDVLISPDEDGIKRLWRNDLISFKGEPENWGAKQGPPRIVGVDKVMS